MPHTINGIGTTYYGKKNVNTYQGVCESCGRASVLQDYETGHYFCIIFLPIIPLGRKQVVGYCSSCTRHRAMPLAVWKQIKQDAINKGMADLAANKQDPQVAMSLINTLTGFHEHQQASDLADAMQSSFRNDCDVQLFLGGWHEQQGRNIKADACFARAYEIDPSHPGAIRAEGVGLIGQGRLEEARALLDQLAPPSPHYDPAVFFILAGAYQQRNQHAQAVEMYDFIKKNSPEWAKDKAFRKAEKKSKKQL